MFSKACLVVALACLTASEPVLATVFRLTATGKVDGLFGQEPGRSLNASGQFQVGQDITYSATFDTFGANSVIYPSTPEINYISLMRPIEYTIQIGDWRYSLGGRSATLSAQMTNDYVAGGGYDSEALSLTETNNASDVLPYDMGNGFVQTISYAAFYGDMGVLSSTDLEGFTDPMLFRTRRFQISFTNWSTSRQYLVQGSINAQLVALPEPSIWMFLIIGFGTIGVELRRRTLRSGYREAYFI